MRKTLQVAALTLAAIVLGACALLSGETKDNCLAIKPMYDEFLDTKGESPTVSEIGTQIDLCFSGLENDSKAFELAVSILKQALKDAWDDFRSGFMVALFATSEEMTEAAKLRAQLELMLETKIQGVP